MDGTGIGTVRKDRKRDFAGDGKGDEEGKRGMGTAEKIRKKRVETGGRERGGDRGDWKVNARGLGERGKRTGTKSHRSRLEE